MRHPRMSTGGWVFATVALVLAVAAPVSQAAVSSRVVAGAASNATPAQANAEGQVLTAPIAPRNVIEIDAVAPHEGCQTVYTPPAGKAIVVMQVTYSLAAENTGTQALEDLVNSACTSAYDYASTGEAYESQTHTFPIGLPMRSIVVYGHGGGANPGLTLTGYLIPASQLPPASQVLLTPLRALTMRHQGAAAAKTARR